MMNNENGRSMVEMLGVLAIIGVLSVAGIAGYSMAMKKYRTNEILNTASQLVVLAQAKAALNTGDQTASLTDLGITTNVAGITSMTATCNGSNKCTVSGGSGDAWDDAKKALNSDTSKLGQGVYYNLS